MRLRSIKNCFLKKSSRKTYSTIEKLFDKKKVQEYHEKGYAVIPKLFSANRIDELKHEIEKIIQSADSKEIKSIFSCDHFESDKYFLESGDKVNFTIIFKISYFLEKDAVDEKGNLKYPLKDSLNKIGHGKF
jgi:phytanoyl-CoA hydroxylase